MVKTRHPFDNLLYWNEYMNYIYREFSKPEENNKWTPKVDIKEKAGCYFLQLDVPGFSSKDIDINYKNGFLTIKGKKKTYIIYPGLFCECKAFLLESIYRKKE